MGHACPTKRYPDRVRRSGTPLVSGSLFSWITIHSRPSGAPVHGTLEWKCVFPGRTSLTRAGVIKRGRAVALGRHGARRRIVFSAGTSVPPLLCEPFAVIRTHTFCAGTPFTVSGAGKGGAWKPHGYLGFPLVASALAKRLGISLSSKEELVPSRLFLLAVIAKAVQAGGSSARLMSASGDT